MSPRQAPPPPPSETLPPDGVVRVYEVSPRDGLQNEPEILPVEAKLRLIGGLVEAGFTDIEVTSFVRASWIPQLADAAELVGRLPQAPGVRYWGLVPNERGLERAVEVGLRHVATFMSASETHNRKNVNRTRQESLGSLRQVIGAARDEGVAVRSYLSTVFGCPYEGPVAIADSVELAVALMDAGADEIALGDTTGMGDPALVQRVIAAMVQAGIPLERLALHMHDTQGTALANVLAGYQAGVRTFDGSIGGVGGCPYAPGASGNAATEDLVHMLHAMGVHTGVDLDRACQVGQGLATDLGRALPGRYLRYWLGANPRVAAARTA